jgi:hypothetical protein
MLASAVELGQQSPHYWGEIARLLGKPEATVRSLLRHARNRIREVMQSNDNHTATGR